MLLSAALQARPAAIIALAALVTPEDLDTASPWRVWEAIADRARDGLVGPEIILDELTRTGQAVIAVRAELIAAATAGGYPEALHAYAAPVIAAALRRTIESHGQALVDAHGTGSEEELWNLVVEGGSKLRGIVDRLNRARRGEL
ncbi:hypothetical protein G6027_10310 [Dietzia sp. SLG310A2-38A2]|uniref:hypothetical protein n=1 Tax=Dietzia sp. SLG310A2-38A2 TaxID=1630643 RepID=UPI0015F9ECBA|nr:hypothetical protein [Dietzia sp. SLG310A2-38A2]MBB1031273.1 hypothetical protein [Dietzia sp. SLG310A2-38A2]